MSASRLRFSVCVASLCLLAACSTGQDRLIADRGPIAKPEVKVGDRWTYRRMDYWKNAPTSAYELRVTFANHKSILAVVEESGRESDASYTAEWNAIVSAFDHAVVSPDTGMLRFPLRPGASYTASFQIDSTRRGGETGARMLQGVSTSSMELKIRVVGWDEIVVPGGRFRALRIEGEGGLTRLQAVNVRGTPVPGGLMGFVRVVYWYAPEARRWVKYTYEDSLQQIGGLVNPNERIGEELVAFKLQ